MANKSIKDAFQRFWEYVTAEIDDQIMVVTVTKNGDTYEANRTYAELAARLDAGGKCEAVYVDGGAKLVLPSVARFSGVLIFTSTDYTNALAHNTVQMYDNGKIRYYDTLLSTGEAETGILLVTVTEDSSGTFTANKTYEQITEAINAGRECKVLLKLYNNKSNGYFMDLVFDATGQYPYVEFAVTSNTEIFHQSLSINSAGTVSYYTDRTYSNPADDYYLRRIKFSETAETPTNEGDICFKLK